MGDDLGCFLGRNQHLPPGACGRDETGGRIMKLTDQLSGPGEPLL
jgi:hypothetical protein